MNVHRPIRTAAAFMVPAILVLLAPSATSEVPAWIAAPGAEETALPLWISIEEAAPNGSLRWEVLTPDRQRWYRKNLRQNAVASELGSAAGDPHEGCSVWTHPGHGRHSEPLSPKELLDQAGVVYRARVLDVSPGFLRGNLGTMIEASVEEVLKPPPAGDIPERILVFYRYAVVRLTEGYLCSSEVRTTTPKVGGTLILAPLEPEPSWPELDLFWVRDADLFFETESGVLSAPDGYKDLRLEASELLEGLRAARAPKEPQ